MTVAQLCISAELTLGGQIGDGSGVRANEPFTTLYTPVTRDAD